MICGHKDIACSSILFVFPGRCFFWPFGELDQRLIGFWVEQCEYALFECSQDVNEITKKHTKPVFW